MSTADDAHHTDARFPAMRAVLRGGAIALAMLVAIRVAEPYLAGAGGYSGAGWHPFWIVVVLSAAQGGLYTGILTAGMATALMGWPDRPIGTDILTYYADAATTPLLWFLSAVVLGAYRQTQIAIEDGLRARTVALQCDNATLADEIDRLDQAIGRMELSAMTRLSAGDRAVAALADLGGTDAAGRAAALATAAGLLTRQPGYVLVHGRSKRILHWGFPDGYAPKDLGGAPGASQLPRPVAGYSHAARHAFALGEVVILNDDATAARADLSVAAVLAHAVERSLRDERPAARLIQATG